MSRLVILDSGPLGLLAIPPDEPEALRCEQWPRGHVAARAEIVAPEVVDHELRRELIRLDRVRSLRRLDTLLTNPSIFYVPITTRAMRLAAQLWAEARRAGRPTADRHALDVDVILAAQARLLADAGDNMVVATTNVRHLTRFVPAADWMTIAPDT